MAEQLLIRVDPELKRKLSKLATMEGKTSTQVIRDLIEDYVRRRDVASYISDLWERIGRSLKSAGVRPGAIARAVRDVRSSKARDAGRR